MASHRNFEYWMSKGMFKPTNCGGIYVHKKSWRRCDKLNGLRGDDRLKKDTRTSGRITGTAYFQQIFTPQLMITLDDQAARVINTNKLVIVDAIPIKRKKMTAYRDLRALEYWTEKGMYARDIPIRVNKTSWRRCDKLNGLRGGDRIETKLYAQSTAKRDYIYERYFIKVLCPQFRLTLDDSYHIEAY